MSALPDDLHRSEHGMTQGLDYHIEKGRKAWAAYRKQHPKLISQLTFPRGYAGCWVWTGPLRGRQPVIQRNELHGQPINHYAPMRRYFHELIIGPMPNGDMSLVPGCPDLLPLLKAGVVGERLHGEAFEPYRRCVNPFHARTAGTGEGKSAPHAESLTILPMPGWPELYEEGIADLWRWARAEHRRRQRQAVIERQRAEWATVLHRHYNWPATLAERVTGQAPIVAPAPPPQPVEYLYLPGLRQARRRRGLSQSQVSARIKLSRSTFAYIEQCQRRTNLDRAQRLAEALGVPLSALTTATDAAAD